MYYITERKSETGLKFAGCDKLMDECTKAQKALGKELGFTQYRPSRTAAFGGISSIVFDIEPDKKLMQDNPNLFAQGYIARNPKKQFLSIWNEFLNPNQ